MEDQLIDQLVANDQDYYLTFRLQDETFGLTVHKVREIIEIPPITKVPKAPDYMRGVINLRGSVLPVIEGRMKFGMQQTSDTVNSVIIVLTIEQDEKTINLGVLVDSVKEVVELEPADIKASPSLGNNYRSDFISGMGKLNDEFIMLLDVDALFSTAEIVDMKKLHEAKDNTIDRDKSNKGKEVKPKDENKSTSKSKRKLT